MYYTFSCALSLLFATQLTRVFKPTAHLYPALRKIKLKKINCLQPGGRGGWGWPPRTP